MYLRALALALLTLTVAVAAAEAKAPPLKIDVISNRADLISAGDALVAVDYASGVDPSKIVVRVGSKDVTSQFAQRENGRYEGLLTELPVGPNTVTAKLPDDSSAKLEIFNHPNGGPVFSGAQVQPW